MSRRKQPKIELSPDDIRRIRESLRLSQVEAGELLGGGPKAFAKYENGSIKPAASVATLLRLLEADPKALPTITGRKGKPIASDGDAPFAVSGEHVAALKDRQLVLLMRKLLNAEAHAHGLDLDQIHVAARITVGDGGEDARISWSNGPERTKYLPGRRCVFQMKATEISPAEAGADVIDSSGAVKSMVADALSAGGTYIMVCSRSYVSKLVQQRVASIRKRLAGAGLKVADAQIQFRDADQIADWVNAHPPVRTWLLEQTQPGMVGPFRGWTHWAGRPEIDSSPWIADERFDEFRAKLRQLIKPEKGVARIVGLSGAGKSRLTFEALGPTDEESVTGIQLCDLVLYAVEQEVGGGHIKEIVQNLADAGARAVIVVDRCPPESHQDLAAIIKRSSSRLSLVTLDHDVPRDPRLPSDTIAVKGASATVIEGILRAKAPKASDGDRPRLVKLASGLPQLARLIGEAWAQDQTIARATDDELFDRILFGRKVADQAKVESAAMLLGVFGLVGAKTPIDGELGTIAAWDAGLNADDLRSVIDRLLTRGVAQMRGRLVALQPRPVALHLAARRWRLWDRETWDKVLFGDLPKRLRKHAAAQLALLNDQTISLDVTRHACRPNGPIASIADLMKEGNAEVISSLAEIDAEVVVELLERLLDSLTVEERKAIEGGARRHLVWALEKIAFVEKTFERGALLLLDLSLAENETWGNNATGQFKALFPVLLANTEAGPADRLRLIDDLLRSNNALHVSAGVQALLSGVRVDSFSRTVGPEIHGSRPALKPWEPKFYRDAWDYVTGCADRLAELAIRTDEVGETARVGLGRQFRVLVGRQLIDKVEEWVGKVSAAHQYWPQALDSLGDVLQYDQDREKPDVVDRVKALVAVLTPKDIGTRVRFIVTEMPWDYPVDSKLDFQERQKLQIKAVDELAIELLRDKRQLAAFFPELSRGDQRMAVPFGRSLAKGAEDPFALEGPIVDALLTTPKDARNFGLMTGFFVGLAERDVAEFERFKRKAALSADLAPAFAFAALNAGLTPSDVELMCQSLRAGIMPAYALRSWTTGGELAKQPPEIVASLFDVVLRSPAPLYGIGLDLMGMYAFQQKQSLESLKPQLRLAAANVGHRMKGRSQMDAHHFGELMQWVLCKGSDDKDASAIALELARHLVDDADDVTDDLVRPLLPVMLSKFALVTWPIIGQAIVADRKKAWQLQMTLGDAFAFDQVKKPMILHLPTDMLFAWCHAHPDIAPAFVAGIINFLTHRDPAAGSPEVDPVAQRLLDEFGDREDVLQALISNIHSFGWSGSRTHYYALYEKPLASLEKHPTAAVRRWAKKMLVSMSRSREDAQDEDDELKASWGE